MERRWKILAGLVVLAVVGAWLLLHAPSPALRDLDNTRRALRRDGFKLDFREFDFALSPDRGRRCTNDAYDSVFRITLPGSGRSQTLRGGEAAG